MGYGWKILNTWSKRIFPRPGTHWEKTLQRVAPGTSWWRGRRPTWQPLPVQLYDRAWTRRRSGLLRGEKVIVQRGFSA